MEVILSQSATTSKKTSNNKKSPKQPTTDTDAPVEVAAYSTEELKDSPKNDNKFRLVIAYIPDAGIFYCVRHKCHCIYILLVLLCYRLHAQLHIRFEHSIAEIRLDRLIGVLHVLLSQLL